VTCDVAELLSFGAYHSQQPLSDQIFQYRRSTLRNSSNRDLLLSMTWELLYFCHSGHLMHQQSQESTLDEVNLEQADCYPKNTDSQPTQSEYCHIAENFLREMLVKKNEKSIATPSEAENALMLRLAVALGLHYQHATENSESHWDTTGLETPITQFPADIITKWEPSEALTEMEIATKALKDLYICTSIKHDYKLSQEVSDQATRLVDCFTNLAFVRRFCDLLSSALSEFALKCDSAIVAKVIGKILKVKRSPTSTFSMWQHLSSPIVALCSKSQSEKDTEKVLETLTVFRGSEWSLLAAQRHPITSPLGLPAYNAQWNLFLDIVRALMPLKDSKIIEWLSLFLSHSPPSKSRDEAQLKLAEISKRPDFIAYTKKLRDEYVGPRGERLVFGDEGVVRGESQNR
jgi:hypothetical protein